MIVDSLIRDKPERVLKYFFKGVTAGLVTKGEPVRTKAQAVEDMRDKIAFYISRLLFFL